MVRRSQEFRKGSKDSVARVGRDYIKTKDQDAPRSVLNNPQHYQVDVKTAEGAIVRIEVVDLIEALYPQDAHMAHAMTYMLRAGRKPSSSYLEDLAKCRWWITRAIKFHGGHSEVS